MILASEELVADPVVEILLVLLDVEVDVRLEEVGLTLGTAQADAITVAFVVKIYWGQVDRPALVPSSRPLM